MFTIKPRVAATVAIPDTGEKTLFLDETDSILKTKDDAGVVESLAVTGGVDPTEPKVYVALLTQSGTDAPVSTVLKNTLGGTPVFSYVGIGQYHLTLAGAFSGTVPYKCYTDVSNDIAYYFQISKIDNNIINISSRENASDPLNDILASTPIKIEVYP